MGTAHVVEAIKDGFIPEAVGADIWEFWIGAVRSPRTILYERRIKRRGVLLVKAVHLFVVL